MLTIAVERVQMRTKVETVLSRDLIIEKVAEILREERAMATNIETAVARAGVDGDSINAIFGSMHGLILEMVSELSHELVQPLAGCAADRPVQDVLTEFGNRLADCYSASHLIALYRIVLSEATRHAGIGREFFERGPGKLKKCLAQYLEYSARRFDQVRISDPNRVAENFLSLLGDNLEYCDAMNSSRSSSAREHSNAVAEAVSILCHGIAVKGPKCILE